MNQAANNLLAYLQIVRERVLNGQEVDFDQLKNAIEEYENTRELPKEKCGLCGTEFHVNPQNKDANLSTIHIKDSDSKANNIRVCATCKSKLLATEDESIVEETRPVEQAELEEATEQVEQSRSTDIEIPRQSVKSSNIKSIGYDSATQTLEVEFNDSAVYQYLDVPPRLYRSLMDAPSVGSFFHQNIKNTFIAKRMF